MLMTMRMLKTAIETSISTSVRPASRSRGRRSRLLMSCCLVRRAGQKLAKVHFDVEAGTHGPIGRAGDHVLEVEDERRHRRGALTRGIRGAAGVALVTGTRHRRRGCATGRDSRGKADLTVRRIRGNDKGRRELLPGSRAREVD